MARGADKASANLIRLLSASGNEGCEVLPGEADVVHLGRRDGGRTRVSSEVLLELERRGIAGRSGGRVRLTDAGRAALRRLAAGEADFAAQHRDIAVVSSPDGGAMAVNHAESPLGVLSRLKQKNGEPWFPPILVAAGDRLRADYTRGQYMPSMGARLEPVTSRGNAARGGGMAELTEAALSARIRVERAVEATGPEIAGLLIDVCCHLKGLELVERERQWPQRSAKLLLRAGLEMLARHYAPDDPGRRRTRKWGADGHRPDIAVDLDTHQK
ncbi:MAG: hypothetical protein CML29_01695 [Rhizobiales bacterium]|nr:hypothetical protein [Hyphomicrobiales bacterium]MBA68040.1 hypothetical protein [Hyphomicrobiales bacterium]|tara:strand:- start:133 stop:948 length:816 start_codon:yes stop_codon:yes gene_type:complete